MLFEPASGSGSGSTQPQQRSEIDPSATAAGSQQYNLLIDAQREPIRFLQSLIDALYRLEQLPNALNDLFDHLYIGLYSCVRTASKAINDRHGCFFNDSSPLLIKHVWSNFIHLF